MRKILIAFLIITYFFLLPINFAQSSSYQSFYISYSTQSSFIKDAYGNEFGIPFKPFYKNNNFIVPLRASIESAQGLIDYNGFDKTILINYKNNKIYLKIGENYAFIGKEKFNFSIKPFIINDRTAVEIGFVARILEGDYYKSADNHLIYFYPAFKDKDALENLVNITQQPKRIVSLSPNITEVIYAIGANDKLVGDTEFCDYPEDAKNKTKVGGYINPSIEKIYALAPDIVLASRGAPLDIVEKLKSLNIKVFTFDPSTVSGIYKLIEETGKISGNIEEALKLNTSMKEKQNKIIDNVNKIPQNLRKKVYVEIWGEPKISAGDNTFLSEIIKIAGGINITKNAQSQWPIVSDELILKENPDLIILLYPADVRNIKNRPGWSNINAVKNNKIFIENPDIFERPGPRIIQAIERVYEILYK